MRTALGSSKASRKRSATQDVQPAGVYLLAFEVHELSRDGARRQDCDGEAVLVSVVIDEVGDESGGDLSEGDNADAAIVAFARVGGDGFEERLRGQTEVEVLALAIGMRGDPAGAA